LDCEPISKLRKTSGYRSGGYGTVSNADLFGEWQWITTRSQIPTYLLGSVLAGKSRDAPPGG
jgi:hypothetical protein